MRYILLIPDLSLRTNDLEVTLEISLVIFIISNLEIHFEEVKFQVWLLDNCPWLKF